MSKLWVNSLQVQGQLNRKIWDYLQEKITIASPRNRAGFYVIFIFMRKFFRTWTLKLAHCSVLVTEFPMMMVSRNCQRWWRNSHSTAFERYADTSYRGSDHLELRLNLFFFIIIIIWFVFILNYFFKYFWTILIKCVHAKVVLDFRFLQCGLQLKFIFQISFN